MNNKIAHFTPDMTTDQMIHAWSLNQALLKELKTVEMDQRKALADKMFPEAKNGTNKHELGAGYVLKYVRGEETKLDPQAFELMRAELPEHVVDKAVKFTPSLVAKGYKDLSLEDRELLDEALVTKPKAPTLEIVPPKEK
ncbi:UNVERIFIED_ORG: hypothetical protein GCAPEGMB_00470 [Vibrio phage V07]